MKEEETIATYLPRVDEVVNTIRGLGEEVDDTTIVKNVLRSLPLIFDAKVCSLEEKKHLNKMTMDQLQGILMAYEMRIEKERPSRKEASFKVSKGEK